MPRGPQILSPQQQRMLEDARAAYLAFEVAERQAKLEYEALLAQRTHPQRVALARAVSTAVLSGVPKSRINTEALGTSSPNAWQRWADLAAAFTEQGQAMPTPLPHTPLPPMQHALPERVIETAPGVSDWPLPVALQSHEHARRLSFMGDPRERRLRVVWPGYESTAPDAPSTLEGIVVYDPATATKWRAEHDPQDKPTPYGTETGAFTYEAETRRGVVPLREALNAFTAAAELPPYEAPGLDVDEDDEGF